MELLRKERTKRVHTLLWSEGTRYVQNMQYDTHYNMTIHYIVIAL